MAPQLSSLEVNRARSLAYQGWTPTQIHDALSKTRMKKDLLPPNLTSVRRVLAGKTHVPKKKETRGRKLKWSRSDVLKVNTTRKVLLKKAQVLFFFSGL